jgi:hypothetical protein
VGTVGLIGRVSLPVTKLTNRQLLDLADDFCRQADFYRTVYEQIKTEVERLGEPIYRPRHVVESVREMVDSRKHQAAAARKPNTPRSNRKATRRP